MRANHRTIVVYRIDADDRLSCTEGDWQDFAVQNGWPEGKILSQVLGKTLWTFIADLKTAHLFRLFVERVRADKVSRTVYSRCDSCDEQREIQITMSALPGNGVEFRSEIVKTSPREPVELLNSEVERSDDFVRICSYCQKIATSKTEWRDIEEACQVLGLLGMSNLPQLTHGICPNCYATVIASLAE